MNVHMIRTNIQLKQYVANKVIYQQAFKLLFFEVFSA